MRLPARLLLALACAVAASSAAAQDDADEEIRPTDLVERAESRLTQIDVSVTGPPEIIGDLNKDDFFLKVNFRRIHDFLVDGYCPAAANATMDTAPGAKPPPRPVSFLFYFDQHHLTQPGRQRALDLSRQLIERLIHDGNRAMIVSNARRLVVVEEFTDNVGRLLEALKRLENDRTQWEFYASQEDSRVEDVVDALSQDDDVHRAISLARTYQREEHWRSDKALRRLEMTLARMADVDSRRAVIYFADTVRGNAGEHYLSFFGTGMRRTRPELSEMALDGLAAGLPMEKVMSTATAHNIRFYTVLAQGLVTPVDRVLPDASAVTRTGAVTSSSRVRFRNVQDTLSNLATETGGSAFIRGGRPVRIVERIEQDFGCEYTLSFDPAGFAEDSPLRAIVEARREGVRFRSKGRVVVESESARLAGRLLSAFASTRSSSDGTGLSANLVPIGFHRGSYSALLQVSVPGTLLPGARWELGASLYSKDKVLEEISGSLAADRPGVPLILEGEIELKAGPFEIVAVARESTTDFILSEHLQISWPDPNDRPVTCGPIALVQAVSGAFLRDDVTRTSGSLARSSSSSVESGLATALMGLVCRGRRQKGSLRVERLLIGDRRIVFPELEFDLDDDRCAQIRDLIPEGSLGPGYYRYIVRAMRGDEVLHESSREFAVVEPGPR